MPRYIEHETDIAQLRTLLILARNARSRAYAPYSKYLVGAALFTESDRVYTGCNVECADYDGTHAEEAALAAMVADGERVPSMIAIVGGLEHTTQPTGLIMPCGKCRQKLREFSQNLVILYEDASPHPQIVELSELLPFAFGPANLGMATQTGNR